MKKRLWGIFMAVVLAGSLAACGDSVSTADTGTADAVSTETDDSSVGGESGAQTKEDEKVTVRFAEVAYFLTPIIEEEGWWDEAFPDGNVELDIINFASGPVINEAFAAGELDIGFIGALPAIQGAANNIPYKIICSIDNAEEGFKIVSKEDSGIESIADLKGKRIGVTIGSAIHSYVLKALADNGLSANDVELVNIPFTEAMATLDKGDIDAAAAFEPHIASGVNSGIDVNLLSTGVGSGTAYSVIVASDDFIAQHADIAAKILDLLERASEWLYENEDQAVAIIEDKYSMDEASIRTTIDTFDYYVAIEDEFREGLDETQQFMLENDLILNEVDLDSFIDDSVYQLTDTAKEGK